MGILCGSVQSPALTARKAIRGAVGQRFDWYIRATFKVHCKVPLTGRVPRATYILVAVVMHAAVHKHRI
jgi:hypothetical protein